MRSDPGGRTRVRDVWDVAITCYGTFPIFTRRYAFHGLENFAFDLLIGKPFLIVAHHDFFRDEGAALIEFLQKLNSLKVPLVWGPLGRVIRRACRRTSGDACEKIEMYSERSVTDRSPRPLGVVVRKREDDASLIASVHVFGSATKHHRPQQTRNARSDSRPRSPHEDSCPNLFGMNTGRRKYVRR
jgi:hypothetical protein